MIESYQRSHPAFLPTPQGDEATWARTLRQRSLERFQTLGFPDKKLETWRHSSTARLARTPFEHDAGSLFEALAGATATERALAGATVVLVLVNGQLALGLSRMAALPDGVHLTPLADLLREPSPAVQRRLDPATWPPRPDASHGAAPAGELPRDRAFDALNTAFMQGGVHLRVDPDVVVDAPIHVLSITVGEGAPIVSHPRLLVSVGRGARAEIVEEHVATGGEPTFTNVLTDLDLQPGAQLVHHLWRHGHPGAHHIGHLRAELHHSARLVVHGAWLGEQWCRSDLDIRFAEPGAEALITGLVLVGGTGHVDTHTWLRHDAPHGTSRQLFKAAATDRSRGVFDGCIHIAPDAQKTQAELNSRNLLLSERAAIFAKPQLEIYADDVIASHGCTIGQLDAEQVQYLRARGIDEAAARALLTRGFVLDLLGEIERESTRQAVERYVFAALDELQEGTA